MAEPTTNDPLADRLRNWTGTNFEYPHAVKRDMNLAADRIDTLLGQRRPFCSGGVCEATQSNDLDLLRARIRQLQEERERTKAFLDWLAEHQASPHCEAGGFGVPKDKLGCITWTHDADWVEVPDEFVELAQRWRSDG